MKITATEKRIQDIRERRETVKSALLEALAIVALLYDRWNCRDHGMRKAMAEDLIEIWQKDEDGDIVMDRLVTLIIY